MLRLAAVLPPALALLALVACETAPRPAPSANPVAPVVPSAPAAEVASVEPELARKLEALAASVEKERVELNLPGVALAIVQDDRLIFARGFGLADVEGQRPVTPETLFAIGSTTKAFTSTLVGMLADEGALTLDDPITEHLPWFVLPIQTRGDEQVTFRDLLSHRTGFARMDVLWAGGTATREEVLRTAMKAEPMAPFRQRFLYNNVMFLAAGQACAAITGRTWEELVRARLLEPLGMRDTDTSVAEAQRDPRLALGYRWDKDKQSFEHLPMRNLVAIAPAGAINSNVLDMSRWVRFQLGHGELEGHRLISREAFDETWKTHNTMSPQGRYGLGWMLHEWQGQPYVEHGGNIDGFAAEVALLPESHLGLVMLANVSATPLQSTIGPETFAALLGEPAAAAAAGAPGDAAHEDLARFTGTFVANYYQFHDAPFEVLVRNERLAIDVPGQTVFELLPPGPDGKRAFALVPQQIQADFEEEDGKVVVLRLYQGGMMFEVPRKGWMPPPEIAPEDAAPYLGTYADPLTKKTFAVVVSRGRLGVDYPEQLVYELIAPKEDERWVFRASPQMTVEFHLDADGAAESLTFFDHGFTRECERVGDAPGAPPPLEEVLALHHGAEFEARLAELGACRVRRKLRFVHCGIEGTNTTLFDAQGRFREETDLAPFVTTSSTSDGTRVVTESTLEGTRELLGANRDATLGGSLLSFSGDWQRRWDEVRVVKTETDGEKKLAVVSLKKGTAPAMLLHLDLATGDPVRADVRELVDGVGEMATTVTFEGWQEVEGLRFPARVVTEDENTGRVVSEFAGLDVGVGGDALGRLPAVEPR